MRGAVIVAAGAHFVLYRSALDHRIRVHAAIVTAHHQHRAVGKHRKGHGFVEIPPGRHRTNACPRAGDEAVAGWYTSVLIRPEQQPRGVSATSTVPSPRAWPPRAPPAHPASQRLGFHAPNCPPKMRGGIANLYAANAASASSSVPTSLIALRASYRDAPAHPRLALAREHPAPPISVPATAVPVQRQPGSLPPLHARRCRSSSSRRLASSSARRRCSSAS